MRRESFMMTSSEMKRRGDDSDDESCGPQHSEHAPRIASAAQVACGLDDEEFDLCHGVFSFDLDAA
jgi:hypothetical protein